MPVFRIKAKALSKNIRTLADLLREITMDTVFTDTGRLIELIEETKASWDMDAFRRGHTLVMHRVLSYVSPVEQFCDAGEFTNYQFVQNKSVKIQRIRHNVWHRSWKTSFQERR